MRKVLRSLRSDSPARRTESLRWHRTTARGCVVAVMASLAVTAPAAASPLSWITDFLTDAATRFARDLKDAAGRLTSSSDATGIVVHRVTASPEGCAHGYRVQLSASSSIVVWCKSQDGQKTVASYSTTSHLPAVDVPRTWIVDKSAGEPLHVELTRTAGKPAVSARVLREADADDARAGGWR